VYGSVWPVFYVPHTKTRTDVAQRLAYGLDDWGSLPSRGSGGILLFATASRPALSFTQPPIQWVPGAFPWG